MQQVPIRVGVKSVKSVKTQKKKASSSIVSLPTIDEENSFVQRSASQKYIEEEVAMHNGHKPFVQAQYNGLFELMQLMKK